MTVFSCICGWSSWIHRLVPRWWPGPRLHSHLTLHSDDSTCANRCSTKVTALPQSLPLAVLFTMTEVLFEYRNKLLGMGVMLLYSYFTLFFWNPPNCFMIYGKKEHCWVSFTLPFFPHSWEKVICLLSPFLNTFSNIVLYKGLEGIFIFLLQSAIFVVNLKQYLLEHICITLIFWTGLHWVKLLLEILCSYSGYVLGFFSWGLLHNLEV